MISKKDQKIKKASQHLKDWEVELSNGSTETLNGRKHYKHQRKANITGIEIVIGLDNLREGKQKKHGKHRKSKN